MLKVLIVDDEPIIREGLKSVIDWERYGFRICGEAENGLEGIKKVNELSLDLAIVDIKMPEMDGLQMIQELRRKNNECSFIVLTAYSDFKFAQKAIELGIDSYVLKPIEQNELIDKVVRVREAIENKNQARQHLVESMSLSRDKIIENILLGQASDAMMDKYNKQYGFAFPWQSYQVVLVEPDKRNSDVLQLRNTIKRELEKTVTQWNYGYVFDVDRYVGILFKNVAFMSYQRTLHDLQAKCADACGVDITLSLGTPVDHIQDISLSYKRACELMDKKFIYGHKRIITGVMEAENIQRNVNPEGKFDMETALLYLCNAMDVNNTDSINDLLEELRCRFIQREDTEDVIKITYTDLYISLLNRLVVGNEALKELMGVHKEVLNEICKKASLQELHGYIKYKLLTLSEQLARLRPAEPMKKILDYIHRNYRQDIKLEKLASLFNYNSVYLGKIFKTYTGECFNTYLDRVRMEKAKGFLKEGLKVYQAAEKTGYKDIDYFYKKFKKYVGVSPSDYKEMGK